MNNGKNHGFPVNFPLNQSIDGWWFQPTPLKKMSERQLGWWDSQYDGKVKKNPVTTNQLYSPIINHYQPLLTMINQDYPNQHIPVTSNQHGNSATATVGDKWKWWLGNQLVNVAGKYPINGL